MAPYKHTISEWLIPCLLTVTVAGIFIISDSNFGRTSPPFESILSQEVEFPTPEYIPMRDNFSDRELLLEAGRVVDAPLGTGLKARIAFLFIVRDDIPHELVWRRFFQGHDDEYSLYVHANPGHLYPSGSLFAGREVPSQPCPRFSRGIVDAFRRLLAHALLDPRYHNAWFVNVCESAVPIRSFAFTYQYLTTSAVSFVESFYPVARYHGWETLPEFNKTELRKGELWMALRRAHAGVVIRDREVYGGFLGRCTQQRMCTWDEEYVQTLLHLRDERGIAKRTVTYVNWTQPHGGSPKVLQSIVSVVKELQARSWDTDGERHDTAFDNTTFACEHDGRAPAPCFLFASKIAAGATSALLAFSSLELGY